MTGDGRVIEQGPQIEIYPGPLLPNVLQRTISEAGVQALLRLAEEHDLFRDVEYEDATNIADAPFTIVTISANGATYEHSAYALGLGGDGTETDEARAALAAFVEQANDVVAAAGADTLGPEEPFEATSYLIRAHVADAAAVEIEPTLVDWPADAPRPPRRRFRVRHLAGRVVRRPVRLRQPAHVVRRGRCHLPVGRQAPAPRRPHLLTPYPPQPLGSVCFR